MVQNFDVKKLKENIAILYKAYMDLNGRENIDELKRISAELELCEVVKNRDTIVVAGMQGTGKTSLVKGLYGLDNILKICSERGEQVPVFITESNEIAEGQYRANKVFINDYGKIEREEIAVDNVAEDSTKREGTVYIELFVAPKYFVGNTGSLALLPGLEKTAREELNDGYNRLMHLCLDFSRAILLVVDEQNIANNDIDIILEITKNSNFDQHNSVFAITKCDLHTEENFKDEIKSVFLSILEEKNFSVPESNVVCTGMYGTEENDSWIEKICLAINGSERQPQIEKCRQMYAPIIEKIKKIIKSLSDDIKNSMNQLEYNELHSPLYDELCRQKETQLEKIEKKINECIDDASQIINKNIEKAMEDMDPKLLKDKKFLVFKKDVKEIHANNEKISEILSNCMFEGEGGKKSYIFNESIKNRLLKEKTFFGQAATLFLPETTETDMAEKESNNILINENTNEQIRYYFDEEMKEHPVKDEKESVMDNKQTAEMLSNALTLYFCTEAMSDVKVPDIDTNDVNHISEEIQNEIKGNSKDGKWKAMVTGATLFDGLDGNPDILDAAKEAVEKLMGSSAGPYVVAAVAVAAVTSGGIFIHNKTIDEMFSFEGAAKNSAKLCLFKERDRLLSNYENAFDKMIESIENVHRAKKKIGSTQMKLENADMALNEIKFICQGCYNDLFRVD